MDQRVGPNRCMASTKPRRTRPDMRFLRCEKCGAFFVDPPSEKGATEEIKISCCCGVPMTRLEPFPISELPAAQRIDYEIVGALNENAIRVRWGSLRPSWLWLETFRGGQYLVPGPKDWKAVFALAGDDAYAYCDKDPCEQCSFRCKNGFVLYAWLEGRGLGMLPLNRIAATSGPTANRTRTLSQNQ